MASELVEAVINGKKNQDSISITGHSLGGGLANYAGLLHGPPSIAFNAKGITLPEMVAIAKQHTGETLEDRAQRLVTNYQVKGEILTGLQNGIAGIRDGAHILTKLPGVGVQNLVAIAASFVRTAPGEVIKTPAIRPDGKEGNIFMETAAEIVTLTNPVADALLEDIDISGPVDRHGMDYMLRGMEHVSQASSRQLLDTLFRTFAPPTASNPVSSGLNRVAP